MSPTSEKLPMNFTTDARTKLKNNGAIFLFSWFIRDAFPSIRDAFPSFSWIRLPAILQFADNTFPRKVQVSRYNFRGNYQYSNCDR